MKRTILNLIFIAYGCCLHAQGFVDTLVNWQQYIPNLMGGNCVEISNVSYYGPKEAYSYFNTNGELGLTEGILMTTGKATMAEGPNMMSDMGYNNELNSHPIYEVVEHLAASIGASSMYNTAFIRFNFRVRDSLDVYIKYVFASEEYNEFVNTIFNDVFGFYVEGPDIPGGIQNIAKIPGTDLPVSINNLNNGYSTGEAFGPCANCEYFVDNTNGQYLQYDAYTVPMTAYFSPMKDSLYTITIIISDVGDGVWDSGVFLNVSTGTSNFSGTVTHNNQPLSAGSVQLFGYNLDSLCAPLVSEVPLNPDGTYTFYDVPYNGYLIRYLPDTMLYPTLTPTYVEAATFWSDARIISLPCDDTLGGIQSRSLALTEPGSGYISGQVAVTKSSDIKVKLNPISRVVMILAEESTGKPVAWAITDGQGRYEFKKVPKGNFILAPEIPLVDNILPATIHNSGKDSLNDIKFALFDFKSKYFDGNWVVDMYSQLLADEKVRVYPNPSQGTFNLFFKDGIWSEDGYLSIRISNMSKQQKNIRFTVPTQAAEAINYLPVSVEELASGIYTISISTLDKTDYIKFIIAK